eukprot:1160722-Pelagomonas_calceolata.AAC.7
MLMCLAVLAEFVPCDRAGLLQPAVPFFWAHCKARWHPHSADQLQVTCPLSHREVKKEESPLLGLPACSCEERAGPPVWECTPVPAWHNAGVFADLVTGDANASDNFH